MEVAEMAGTEKALPSTRGVYFARVVGTDLYKIGVSIEPQERVNQFGPPCQLLYSVRTFEHRCVESDLLERLSDYVHGGNEWLRLPEDVASDIPEMMDSMKIETPSEEAVRVVPSEEMDSYTPKDIAEITGRHPESIRRKLRSEDLEGHKMGAEWIVFPDALREWLGDEVYENLFLPHEDEA